MLLALNSGSKQRRSSGGVIVGRSAETGKRASGRVSPKTSNRLSRTALLCHRREARSRCPVAPRVRDVARQSVSLAPRVPALVIAERHWSRQGGLGRPAARFYHAEGGHGPDEHRRIATVANCHREWTNVQTSRSTMDATSSRLMIPSPSDRSTAESLGSHRELPFSTRERATSGSSPSHRRLCR